MDVRVTYDAIGSKLFSTLGDTQHLYSVKARTRDWLAIAGVDNNNYIYDCVYGEDMNKRVEISMDAKQIAQTFAAIETLLEAKTT